MFGMTRNQQRKYYEMLESFAKIGICQDFLADVEILIGDNPTDSEDIQAEEVLGDTESAICVLSTDIGLYYAQRKEEGIENEETLLTEMYEEFTETFFSMLVERCVAFTESAIHGVVAELLQEIPYTYRLAFLSKETTEAEINFSTQEYAWLHNFEEYLGAIDDDMGI